MVAASVAFSGGTFCFYMASGFASDWMRALRVAEENAHEVELDLYNHFGALFHAVFATVTGVGFMAFASQTIERTMQVAGS